ncbi:MULTISPECIES: hypothetical protein [unclassified Variovorax]|uniref:hypothetical protein n=1 Tax=unclassified Variovorax TaxID=663243 RepID=UPI002B2247F2|nr:MULTISPECIES: hypothetical protein [unclassified Variovorax]MEB0056372.1 hypothetical protein [Variovorax sp. LG9.2]MEB0113840.1 hypothetical protein [Variovorax sp. RTB1]
MDTWLERQAPFDKALANALIAATPETWARAEVEVSRDDDGATEEMSIVITSPDGRPEVVSATEDLFAALYGLSDFFRERGTVWNKIVCSVAEEAGDWTFKVSYEY